MCVPGLYLLECAVAGFRPLRVLMVWGRKGMATSRWYLRGNKKKKNRFEGCQKSVKGHVACRIPFPIRREHGFVVERQ